MHPFDYHTPGDLDEVLELLDEHGEDARPLAGGTAIAILLRQQLLRPDHVISMSRVGGLSSIEEANGGLSLGPLLTHRELETSTMVQERFPSIAQTMRTLATIRIRNHATVGGSVVHGDPALDLPVTLLALDAQVHLKNKAGSRTIPVDDFFLDYYETAIEPDELVVGVDVPFVPDGSATYFLKFLPRTADDYATVAVSTMLSLDASTGAVEDVRIALGAVGSTVIRARAAEDALRGQQPGDEAFRAAGAAARDEVDPIADVRGSREYKIDMTEVNVRRALERTHALIGAGAEA